METGTKTKRRLCDLVNTEQGIITKVYGYGAFRKRITEMGFVQGKTVTVIKNAPLQDPIEYKIMDYLVSLRRSEAGLIEVVPLSEAREAQTVEYLGTVEATEQRNGNGNGNGNGKSEGTISVALVGNPNSGKTTLFNRASGAHERVGNYAGVTIDAKEAEMRFKGTTFSLVDLPGTYSITEYTPEELYVRSHIINNAPDVIVNVIDASNLERNLYLTTQLIDMQVKVVIALNMFDEFQKTGAQLDIDQLSKLLGIPIVPTVASRGKGIPELLQTVRDVHMDKNPVQRFTNINYGRSIEEAIGKVKRAIEGDDRITGLYSPRYLAIKMLEQDHSIREEMEKFGTKELLEVIAEGEIKKLEDEYKEKTSTIMADAKYGFIAGALGETLTQAPAERRKNTRDIDNLFTHKVFGFPIFIFFMWLMFEATFTIGSYPMDLIDAGVGWLAGLVSSFFSEGPLRDLIVDGIIGGVGGVIIFLPNILILFFFISLMEDTGYMARAAFIMDKLMHKIGLHGKSFIPLIMGFGCNVPAVMATRTMENRKDRLVTMMITPFMSCSARLPVYVLIISAIFTRNQGLVLFSIYAIGIFIAVLVALLLNRFMFKKEDVPFVMELPPYRMPTLRNTTKHMWFKAAQYLKKMGGVILAASIIIWALGYFPRDVEYSRDYDAEIAVISENTQLSDEVKEVKVLELQTLQESERQAGSYIGILGKTIEPIIEPLGFDWKIGIAIITGMAAKEIVVSTMGVLYQADLEADENSGTLQDKLKEQVYSSGPNTGEKIFTPLVGYSFMLFVLIYFPCVAVIAAVRKEANWLWALFLMGYTTGVAWLVSFFTYQIGSLF